MYSLVFNLGTLVACVVLGFYLFRKRPGASQNVHETTPSDDVEGPSPTKE